MEQAKKQKTYDVHTYALVRVKVQGIKADSMFDAVKVSDALIVESGELNRFLLRKGSGNIVESEAGGDIMNYLVDEVDPDNPSTILHSEDFEPNFSEDPSLPDVLPSCCGTPKLTLELNDCNLIRVTTNSTRIADCKTMDYATGLETQLRPALDDSVLANISRIKAEPWRNEE